eukprot:CAMPEP_0182424538 /NCGR_PEP_ID=MMETSP1167-20130531/10751_1 /TAXON_ID=2988 /ORGANISM="Mallomonas Sp, Strain CCMP3275" /LENGTH=195 /DNA_ID=CAMNT_0024604423 /DNA_START=281 /DNA_END=868 /DNA_ORIENTATION=+
MNGLLILSLDSGMLLFSQYFVRNFGLDEGSAGADPMQLSGLIFTLYKTAMEIEIPHPNDVGGALSFFNQGKCTLHFVEDEAGPLKYLVVLSVNAAFDQQFAKDCARRFSLDFKKEAVNASDLQKQASLKNSKQFRENLLHVMNAIQSELAYDVYQSVFPGVEWITVCLPEQIPGFWSDSQLHEWFREQYARQPAA